MTETMPREMKTSSVRLRDTWSCGSSYLPPARGFRAAVFAEDRSSGTGHGTPRQQDH